jgi:chromosome segregation ATPase
LTDYRDRLTELAKRADAKVEDLIKVEQELSNTQSQIEQITAQQSHLNQQVATELLTINLSADAATDGISGPVAQVWHNGRTVLGQNAAAALRVAIGALPWLAIGAVALALLAGLRALFRRRRKS